MSTSKPLKTVDVLSERPLAQIRAQIRELESLDLRSQEPNGLLVRVRKICRGYMWMTRVLRGDISAFRARRLSVPPDWVADMWYPPASAVASIGRANGVNESVLYTSSNGTTAISELRPAAGDTFCVIELGLRDPARGLHLHELALAESSERRSAEEHIPVFHHGQRGRAVLINDDNVAKLDEIRSFMVDHFTRAVQPGQENEYGVSLAIARYHRNPGIDGLMYPSVARELTGTNAVFEAPLADQLFVPLNFCMVRVDRVDANSVPSFDVIQDARAFGPDGRVFW